MSKLIALVIFNKNLEYIKPNHHSLDDKELVEKIVESNNTYFFAILYDRYVEVIFNKCLSFVKSKEEAEDLTHDIFILLFAKLKTFKGESKFSTWLYSLVYNHCVNYLQRVVKKKNEKFVEVENIHIIKHQILDEEIYKLNTGLLKKALQKLKPEDKMVLFMKYQDDMTVKGIMEVLNLGESAVKMRLNRAKARLINSYKNL